MPNIGAFFTATIARQLPGLSDLIIKDSPFLNYLKRKKRFKFGVGGDGFSFRLRNADSAIFGSTSDWGTKAAQTTQPFTTVSNVYRQYDGHLMINNWQTMRNKNAGPEAKMFNMVAEQLNEIKQSATQKLTTHSFDGTNTTAGIDIGNSIDGLRQIVAARQINQDGVLAAFADANTYLGLDRTAAAQDYWGAQIFGVSQFGNDPNSTGVTNGLKFMRKAFRACSQGKQEGDNIPDSVATGKDKPDFVICDSDSYGLYEESLLSKYRYTGEDADPEKLLTFMGAGIEWDPNCQALTFWFLNSAHIQMDCVGEQLLDIITELDVAAPIAHIWVLGFQGNMYSKKPRYLGKLQYTV